MKCRFSYHGLLLAVSLAALPGAAFGQSNGSIGAAEDAGTDDAPLSRTAAAAMRGPLPMNKAEVAQKRAANRAAAKSAAMTAAMDPRDAESGLGGPTVTQRPTVVDDHAFDGIPVSPPTVTEPLTVTGAIGPTRYIQAANRQVRIYNRTTDDELDRGSLSQLAGPNANPRTFNPQIIWDPSTARFYYVMNAGNKLAFGFSKGANPVSVGGSDWCPYVYSPPAGRFPDYPRLGDSRHFIIIGVNSFSDADETVNQYDSSDFVGSDLIAISKPPPGATCPKPASFNVRQKLTLRDNDGRRVFTPVPANQIDNNDVGYVVARHGDMLSPNDPAKKLWFFDVTRSATGMPVITGNARGVTLKKEYNLPPDAAQPDTSRRLETLDARPTQAVQARNPRRNRFSFWVQHTVAQENGGRSVVRWYEIDPTVNTPALLRSGEIGTRSRGNFFFNAAISPDRRVDRQNGVSVSQFGDSFVIQYNVSSGENEIAPRIVAGSSLAGGTVTFRQMKGGAEPYLDASCPDAGTVCRWASYAGASPDPRPLTTDRGMVWGTNQYTDENASNGRFRSWIFGVQP